jgi:hypothetical protein
LRFLHRHFPMLPQAHGVFCGEFLVQSCEVLVWGVWLVLVKHLCRFLKKDSIETVRQKWRHKNMTVIAHYFMFNTIFIYYIYK